MAQRVRRHVSGDPRLPEGLLGEAAESEITAAKAICPSLKTQVYWQLACVHRVVYHALRGKLWLRDPDREATEVILRKADALAGDSVEMAVSNPPLTREALQELLCEQLSYCDDLVQIKNWFGKSTLENIAYDLLGVHQWEFWWD